MAPSLRALSWQLGSTQTRPRFKMTVTVIGHYDEKIKTQTRLLVITVTRKAILPTNALSLTSQKPNVGLGNLLVGNCC